MQSVAKKYSVIFELLNQGIFQGEGEIIQNNSTDLEVCDEKRNNTLLMFYSEGSLTVTWKQSNKHTDEILFERQFVNVENINDTQQYRIVKILMDESLKAVRKVKESIIADIPEIALPKPERDKFIRDFASGKMEEIYKLFVSSCIREYETNQMEIDPFVILSKIPDKTNELKKAAWKTEFQTSTGITEEEFNSIIDTVAKNNSVILKDWGRQVFKARIEDMYNAQLYEHFKDHEVTGTYLNPIDHLNLVAIIGITTEQLKTPDFKKGIQHSTGLTANEIENIVDEVCNEVVRKYYEP